MHTQREEAAKGKEGLKVAQAAARISLAGLAANLHGGIAGRQARRRGALAAPRQRPYASTATVSIASTPVQFSRPASKNPVCSRATWWTA